MTGNGDPSPNGLYLYVEHSAGKPAFKHETEAWYLYWAPTESVWALHPELGEPGGSCTFERATITGTYDPNPPATGNPQVTELP